MQESILSLYLKSRGHPSLRKIAEETGIQLTRVFRLMNGYEMKLSEYLKFSSCLRKTGDDTFDQFLQVAQTCVAELSPNCIEELKGQLERLIKLKILMRQIDRPSELDSLNEAA